MLPLDQRLATHRRVTTMTLMILGLLIFFTPWWPSLALPSPYMATVKRASTLSIYGFRRWAYAMQWRC